MVATSSFSSSAVSSICPRIMLSARKSRSSSVLHNPTACVSMWVTNGTSNPAPTRHYFFRTLASQQQQQQHHEQKRQQSHRPQLPFRQSRIVNMNSDSSGEENDKMTNKPLTTWRSQLLQAGNFASLLCAVDCTVLPVVTLMFPLMGMAAPSSLDWLHEAGHAVALGFVLPVGGSATLLNYFYAHRQRSIASLGCLGLVLVTVANVPHSALHLLDQRQWFVLHSLLHATNHGSIHHMTKLGSNYLSHQSGKCLHVHDHSETSSRTHNHHEHRRHDYHK